MRGGPEGLDESVMLPVDCAFMTAGAAWKSWASVPVSVLRRRVVVTKQLMLQTSDSI